MTDNMKKFAELLSVDKEVMKELDALVSGLSKDDRKGFVKAAIKVAAQHGITLTEEEFNEEKKELKELSLDEMQAVAGGVECKHGWFKGECDSWFAGRCDSLFD